jgi:hypothetical protein
VRNQIAILGAAAAIVLSVMFSSPHASIAASTFVVNKIGNGADLTPGNGKCDVSTNMGLQCTLKAAIQEANALAGADTINFNITSASKTIQPPSQLPQITQAVTINGYSQSGASANTQAIGNDAVLKIVLDGVNAPSTATGLRLTGTGVVVKGLDIVRWGNAGIEIAGGSSSIAGNFIGVNAPGAAVRANGKGIVISGGSHLIGQISPDARNLISGNVGDGIVADGITNSVIAGNYIGTTSDGSADLGNRLNAIVITNSNNVTIGGNDGTPGNVISGDDRNGIACTDSHDIKIKGNLIGTSATGLASIGLGDRGVNLLRCANVTIGGLTMVERNTISSTLLGIDSVLSDNGIIQGNRIGTNSNGIGGSAFGNRFGAIHVTGTNTLIGGAGAAGNVIANSLNASDGIFISDATGTTVQGNSIAGNTGNGIQVWHGPAQILGNQIVSNSKNGIVLNNQNPIPLGIRISGNVIFANGELGIDLPTFNNEDSFGVTPNDNGDGDFGPNRVQNFPVLASALRASNGITVVQGSLNSTASTTFRVELFLANPDPSGHGEALAFLATKNVTTAANGNVSFSFQIASVGATQRLTATAINEATGDTSEFSANVVIVQGRPANSRPPTRASNAGSPIGSRAGAATALS